MALIADRLWKPELDDRSYRVIQLPNQLEAGSFSDGESLPGIFHGIEQ
jgi:hypothetical protein